MKKDDAGASSKPSVQVLERMFTLIDVLASREEAIPLKEISEKTGLHPSTAHRILNDLSLGRFVDRPESGSYRLGMRLLELGNLVKARLNVRDAALPAHAQPAQADPAACQPQHAPGRRDRLCRAGLQRALRHAGGPRHRRPRALHLTSTGKLFLAVDDPQRVRAYAVRTGLAGHTRNSITQLPQLERELGQARQYGIARDNEELELGVRCMAAGVFDDQGQLVAGLSISAPADRLDENWLPKLQATADEISAALGYDRDRARKAAGSSHR